MRNSIINIANKTSWPIIENVNTMEKILGKSAVYDIVDEDTEHTINIHNIKPVLDSLTIYFDKYYLEKIFAKH